MWAYVLGRALVRRQIVRLLPAAGAGVVSGAVLFELIAGIAPVAFIVATSFVVGRVPAALAEGLASPEWAALRNALVAASGLYVFQQLLWPVQWVVSEAVTRRVDDAVGERIVTASFAPAGVAALEDEATLDELRDIVDPLRGTGFSPGSACAGMLTLVSRYGQALLAAATVGVIFAWWAGLAAAAGAVAVRIGARSGLGWLSAIEQSYAPARRRRAYLRSLLQTGHAAKEVRIFGLLPWLQKRFRRQALAAVEPVWKVRRRTIGAAYAFSLPVAALLAGIASIGVARAAAGGGISLQEFALAVQALLLVGRLGEPFFESDYAVEFGMRSYGAVERFERRAVTHRAAEAGDKDPAGRPRSEIRFEGVWFAYPGTERPVLANFDLRILAGQSLAIVGLNGAGKTTLIKLLARMYEPQRGRITVDGIDIREFPAAQWQRRIAAIFQDFIHYELPVADNVGFGAPEFADDRERIGDVVAAAGAAGFVAALPHGLDTVLSREYDRGAELSGGQWQRIAMARALMAVRGGAGVLVLDEPTANLDVRAEAEIFDRLLDLTRGVTTILISHRFSTVRHADRIVVLADGQVVEDGSHAELLGRDGRYAHLFRLQAARFADSGG